MSEQSWRAPKEHRSRAAAARFVSAIKRGMPGGTEFHVCGSWRRGAGQIGDLDVVVVTADGRLPALPPSFRPQQSGPRKALGDIVLPAGRMHADFRACTPAELGAHLLYFTGPRNLNIAPSPAA